MSAGDPTDQSDRELEDRLRSSFASTRLPIAPATIRSRPSELVASERTVAGPGRSRAPWLAAAAAVLAIGLVGSVLLVGSRQPSKAPPSGDSTSPSNATASAGLTDALFAPGQATSGDGWRLIAGGVGLRREPTGPVAPRIELFSGAGLVKPREMLDIPSGAPSIDDASEALLVMDLLVGSGPGCGQVRFDGVTFDQALHTLTARYTQPAGGSGPSGSPAGCQLLGVPAALAVAIARTQFVPGEWTLELQRSESATTWTTIATASIGAPTMPVPLSEATVADGAGSFPKGGLWATRQTLLSLSTDGGRSWASITMPVAATPFVLDPGHIWIASAGPGSSQEMGSSTDVLHLVVDRTADGGRTWQRATVEGDFAGTTPVLAFADAQHGYLLAAGLRFGNGSRVFRTNDGGVTWHEVLSTVEKLGSIFGLGPDGSLWAGTEGDAGPVERPVLDVSRDGGKTWVDARLPGLEGSRTAVNTVVGPPAFFGDDGAVGVTTPGGDGCCALSTFVTADRGRTWSRAGSSQAGVGSSPALAFVARGRWIMSGPRPDTMRVTDDGGATWRTMAATGLAGQPLAWLGFADPNAGAGLVYLGDTPAPEGLVVTSDGGASWTRASIEP